MSTAESHVAAPTRFWLPVATYLVVAVLGLVGGWIAARQGGGQNDGGHQHGGAASAGDPAQEFGPELLANLGVEQAAVSPQDYVATRSLPAHVAVTPFTLRPLQAPWGGIVRSIQVEPGEVVEPGQTVMTLTRDPIPRPDLSMTEPVLKPANEDVHGAVSQLLAAQSEVDITTAEIARISTFVDEVVPRNRIVDLRYTLIRAESQKARALEDLGKHGYSDAQIAAIISGDSIPPLSAGSWRRALRKNGLWPESAAALYDVLPELVQQSLWGVASVGELAARGLDTQALVEWFAQESAAAHFFLEITALLQLGHTVDDAKRLFEQGAFSSIIEVRAPQRQGTQDWDVLEIVATEGSLVQRGEALLSLSDPRQLYLITEPVGGEEVQLLQAAAAGSKCHGRPWVSGAGPELADLEIAFLKGGAETTGTMAYVTVENQVLRHDRDSRRRSWALRPGLRYALEIPLRQWQDVYVLPAEAVAEVGPEKVILIPDGGRFRTLPVEVLYQDHDTVLLRAGAGSKLFPGDEVVIRGAFALSLALSGSSKVDAHAGHSH